MSIKLAEKTGGAILLITEGVFGMSGDQGNLKEIVSGKLTKVCTLPDTKQCPNFKYGGTPYELQISM